MRIYRGFVFALLILLPFACRHVDSTAPSGATITLTAQPNSVDKNGSVGLTVSGTRANGAPLADDTVVRFTVDATFGVVTPNPVETTDGVAHATFIAGQNSGTATIVATSGEATDDVEIVIGDARVDLVIVTSSPSTLPIGGGTAKLKAFVRDENGNPVSGVQVFFETDQGTLASHGDPVVTDSGGVSRDTLNTDETATVTATTSGGVEGQVTVSVTSGEGPTCGFASPTTGVVGEQIFFVDTSTDPDGFIDESTWDFGDGSDANGLNVSHTYDEAGSFVVVHTVTDNQGFTSICSPVTITISEGEGPQCSFEVTPTGSVAVNQQISFADTSTDTDGTIEESDWAFGDGTSRQGTNVTHAYTAPGDYFVLHTVVDDDGLSNTCAPLAIHVGGTPSVSINDVNGNEATANMTFTITLSSATGLDVDVTYQTSDCGGTATATANSDFTSVSPTVATIPAGSTSTQVSVTIINDLTDEGSNDLAGAETFCVDLSSPVNATISDGRGTGSIIDND